MLRVRIMPKYRQRILIEFTPDNSIFNVDFSLERGVIIDDFRVLDEKLHVT